MPQRHTLLLVDDAEGLRTSVAHFFTLKGFRVIEADGLAAGVDAYSRHRPDIAVIDHSLPDGDGLGLIRALRAVDSGVPIIVLTAHGTIDLAVRAVKEGAEQFFTKPVELPALLLVVQRLLESQRHRQTSLAGRSRDARAAVDPFLGESRAIRLLADHAVKVLESQSPILIQGETGTGKGVLARWLHEHGPRADDAFVDLNCAGLAREFLETELFGHERGAFTGAVSSKPGLFEIAHRGSLFLDEIGDVDPHLQPKLLKVLEEQRFRRLGDVRDRQVDVRLIAATHQDLEESVRSGRFRGDLYYRISALPLAVPPLRERGPDVVVLARVLLSKICADLGRSGIVLDAGGERALMAHSWPGNVRELRNLLERVVLLGCGERIDEGHIRAAMGRSTAGPAAPGGTPTLEAVEKRHIESVLREQNGSVTAAAALLGLSRSALYDKLKKHGLSRTR
ncbi:MAG: sigma-54 dependent transcriptional regulator [Vicinamibacteria bacterium]